MSVCFYVISMTLTLAICNLWYYIYLHCLIHCIVTIFLKCTCTIKLCRIFCLIYFRVFVKINLDQCQCQCQCQYIQNLTKINFIIYYNLTNYICHAVMYHGSVALGWAEYGNRNCTTISP